MKAVKSERCLLAHAQQSRENDFLRLFPKDLDGSFLDFVLVQKLLKHRCFKDARARSTGQFQSVQ